MDSVPYEEIAVARLVESSTRADGHPPFSGHKLEVVGGRQSRTGTWSDGSGLCAVGVAAFHEEGGHWAVEIAVAPDCRGPRMEKASIRAATGLVADATVHAIWAFRTDQLEAAKRLGYEEIRSVIRMAGLIPKRANGPASRIPIGTMELGDIGELVAVNNRAFRGHPEQGSMTEERFTTLMDQRSFDSAGVLVARDGERVAGFCIAKYEAGRVGEIFVIAVDPIAQRSGVGRDLMDASFEVLQSRGVRTVNVWVDERNEDAIRLYASLGLTEDFRTRELALP